MPTNITNNPRLIDSSTLAASATSLALPLGGRSRWSVQAIVENSATTAVGTLEIQVTNGNPDTEDGWTTVSGGSLTVSTATDLSSIVDKDLCVKYVRVKYTRTSGSATSADVWVHRGGG